MVNQLLSCPQIVWQSMALLYPPHPQEKTYHPGSPFLPHQPSLPTSPRRGLAQALEPRFCFCVKWKQAFTWCLCTTVLSPVPRLPLPGQLLLQILALLSRLPAPPPDHGSQSHSGLRALCLVHILHGVSDFDPHLTKLTGGQRLGGVPHAPQQHPACHTVGLCTHLLNE